MSVGRKGALPRAKYVVKRALLPAIRRWQMLWAEPAHLACDEPASDSKTPRSGVISVKGWAVAKSGVDLVRVRFGDSPWVTAQLGFARPDVAKVFPLPGADRSGWSCTFDTCQLPNQQCDIHVEALSKKRRLLRLKRHINIDHEKGFRSDYDRWISEFETGSEEDIRQRLARFSFRPKVSIVLPVYKCPPQLLRQAIESVLRQSYGDWELCIADDHSGSPEITALLEAYASQDSRIKFTLRTANGGISAASNSALRMAAGEFVSLLDHDDEYAPDALSYFVDALQRHGDADLLYSDEDKIDEAGQRYDPFFKPDWSPDLLLSMNYVSHLLMFRRDLLQQTGAFRSEYDGSQDYDLTLRLARVARHIVHIPHILYHWRSVAGSTAAALSEKQYTVSAARRAIEDNLKLTRSDATVHPASEVGRWRIAYSLSADPSVSIIIASGGKVQILAANVRSIFEKTTYRSFEVVVADNSKGDEIQALTTELLPLGRIRYFDWRNRSFNYSVINNRAAESSRAEILLFLNDDTSVIASGWLTAMVQQAWRPEVGAVGAKLLYPDGRIQHAGVVLGPYENCAHAFKGLDGARSHYFSLSDVTRNVSAVTGACLMTRASVFREVNGFDEQTFAVAFNDVDLCLKIGRAGYRIVYEPAAVLYHYEAFSKGRKDLIPHRKEVAAMQTKWADVIADDPYYNRNLTRSEEDWSLRKR